MTEAPTCMPSENSKKHGDNTKTASQCSFTLTDLGLKQLTLARYMYIRLMCTLKTNKQTFVIYYTQVCKGKTKLIIIKMDV